MTNYSYKRWGNLLKYASSINDIGYAKFVGSWDQSYYVQRLKNIGFYGSDRVLDVGCGYGLWSIALASLNARVDSIDIHEGRINICKKLVRDFWISNIYPMVGCATVLPYPDSSFDAIFCYGVFMFVDSDAAISEFKRVLKPGGKIYLCLNGPGWWLSLAIKNLFKNKYILSTSLKSLFCSNSKHKPTSFSISSFSKFLRRHELEHVVCRPEGSILQGIYAKRVKPVYRNLFFFLDYVIEATCSTTSTIDHTFRHSAPLPIDLTLPLTSAILESLKDYTYSYNQRLLDLHSSDNCDIVNCSVPRLMYSLTYAHSDIKINATLYYYVNSIILRGVSNPLEKVKKLLLFCQLYFYHHFSIQPTFDGILVTNPIQLLDFKLARCGTQARFLCDLLDIAGFQTGLLQTPNHVVAEVYIDSEWRLLDPNLYPPGIYPQESNGCPLSTSVIIQNPFLLDRYPNYINYNHSHVSLFSRRYPIAYEQISDFLVYPLFPSSSYFSHLVSNSSSTILLSRLRKNSLIKALDYSQSRYIVFDSTDVTVLPKVCRSSQPHNIRLDGNFLSWDFCFSEEVCNIPLFKIHISSQSRGWAYDKLDIDCKFSLPHCSFSTTLLRIDISSYVGIYYITVVASDPGRPDSFCLPSDEFVLYN